MISPHRINLIIRKLLDKEKVSIKNLVQEFSVSERTILRDLTEKIPLIISKKISKKNGFYFLDRQDNQDKNNDDVIISLLLEEAKNQGKSFYEDALEFFKKVKENIKINTLYKQSNNENIENSMELILSLLNHIDNEDFLSCEYNGKKRSILPIKIVNFDGFWYLILKDLDKKIVTKYHLKSIKSIEKITKREFRKPCKLNLNTKLENGINAFFDVNSDFFPVILHIEKEVAKYFIRKPLSKTQRILKSYDDNSIDIEIYITNEMEIIPTIQKYMPFVKVVEPEFIFKKIEENIKKML